MTQAQIVTIASGAALSSPVSMPDGFKPVALLMPAAFDGAKITLQITLDGASWYNTRLAYQQAQELEVEAAAGSAVRIEWFPSWAKQFRLRSGTSGSPTNQTAERAIGVVFER